jgi:hypothetical protein
MQYSNKAAPKGWPRSIIAHIHRASNLIPFPNLAAVFLAGLLFLGSLASQAQSLVWEENFNGYHQSGNLDI